MTPRPVTQVPNHRTSDNSDNLSEWIPSTPITHEFRQSQRLQVRTRKKFQSTINNVKACTSYNSLIIHAEKS